MRDVAPRARRQIELPQPPVEIPQHHCRRAQPGGHAVGGLAEHDGKQVGDRAFLDPQRAVHVGFAELELGIEQHAALGGRGHEPQRHRPPGAIAER